MVDLGVPDQILTELPLQKLPAGDKHVLYISTFRGKKKLKKLVRLFSRSYGPIKATYYCVKLDNRTAELGTCPYLISVP